MKNIFYKPWKRTLTFLGDIMFAIRPPKVRAKHIRDLLKLAKKGDIICRKYIYHLDNYYIPNKYTHSGIVEDDMMIHSVIEGVERVDVIDFIKDCDGFIILRPSCNIEKMIDYAKSKIGLPYDVWIDGKDDSSFYCHELTAKSLIAGGFDFELKKVILADDIIKLCEVIYESN